MSKVLVFYAGLLYGEYPNVTLLKKEIKEQSLPSDCYIYFANEHSWYYYDYSVQAMTTENVPKELLVQVLLLT